MNIYSPSAKEFLERVTSITGATEAAAINMIMAGLSEANDDFLDRLLARAEKNDDCRWHNLAPGESVTFDPRGRAREIIEQARMHSIAMKSNFLVMNAPMRQITVMRSSGPYNPPYNGRVEGGGSSAYGFDQLIVGQTVIIPTDAEDERSGPRISSAARMFAHRRGIKVVCRTREDGIHVTRIG